MKPATGSAERTGFALLLSLIGLVLLAVMATALFQLTLGETRRLATRQAQTRVDAEVDQAAFQVMRDWIPGAFDSLQTGDSLPAATTASGGLSSVTHTMRLSTNLWWSSAFAQVDDSLGVVRAKRGVNVAWRTTRPEPVIRATLTARDSVSVLASAMVVGTDSSALAFPFCTAPAPVAGVALPDTSRLCDGTCGAGAGMRVVGAPPVIADSITLDTLTYTSFGSESWTSLARMADVTIAGGTVLTPAPVVTSGSCDRTRLDNWGDPFGISVCSRYAPILHATGDLEMRGGVGHGILLVDGDLTLSQGARFAGLVITGDDVIATGTSRVWGALLAADRRPGTADHSYVGGSARLQYSSCVLEAAFRRSGRLVPVRERAWAVIR